MRRVNNGSWLAVSVIISTRFLNKSVTTIIDHSSVMVKNLPCSYKNIYVAAVIVISTFSANSFPSQLPMPSIMKYINFNEVLTTADILS